MRHDREPHIDASSRPHRSDGQLAAIAVNDGWVIQMSHTPPLGYAVLTPFYDRVIAAMTREKDWRACLVEHIDARLGETILDVGSGTGSLAIAVTAAAPGCHFHGIDPDASAIEIARHKALLFDSAATFELGSLGEGAVGRDTVDKVVCSLVLHQVPIAEKRRLIRAMLDLLRPGGQMFIADYGRQPTIAMRLAFRVTVQMLDGKSDTQPNADGILPLLIHEAGFITERHLAGFDTATGRIEIICAEKPKIMGHVQ